MRIFYLQIFVKIITLSCMFNYHVANITSLQFLSIAHSGFGIAFRLQKAAEIFIKVSN